MFGLFGKSRFPKWEPGAQLGKYEVKIFVSQKKIIFDWKYGDDAMAMFVPWLLQEQLVYLTGLAMHQRQLITSLLPYLDAPVATTTTLPGWQFTNDVKPENYLLMGGIWLENGIGGTVGVIGGPAGPDVETARAEALKALIGKTGNDPRTIAACRHVIAFQQELGDQHNYKKRGGRVIEAWRLASGGVATT